MEKTLACPIAISAVIPELSHTLPPTASAPRTYWRFGLRLSSAVHLFALGLVASELYWTLLPAPSAAPSAAMEIQAEWAAPAAPPALQVLAAADDAPAASAAALASHAVNEWAVAIADPRLLQVVVGDEPAAGELVQDHVRAAIRAAEQLPAEDQLARLQALTGQLNRVASDESVDEFAGKFQKLLGTSERAAVPVAGAAGDFDFQTAQFHDVKREANPDGSYTYTSILVDAAGRQMQAPLSEADGANLYRVMELIKANPLLERLYRGVVMSLLDKLAKPM